MVTFFTNRFHDLARTNFLIRVQKPLEIEPDSAPEPDIAIVRFRADYYGASHPNGSDAYLVLEVDDTERKPREKMRIDIPGRCVELWSASKPAEPTAVLYDNDDSASLPCHLPSTKSSRLS